MVETSSNETNVSLPEFVRAVSNGADSMHANDQRVDYFKDGYLIGYSILVPRDSRGGLGIRCVKVRNGRKQ